MASVDVVVPNYQYGRYLRDCVQSVLSQDIDDVRVLIIDNASADDSVEVARQLAAEDRRIEVVARQRNAGAHASFNEGVDWARADYFMVLCADDLVAPGAFARAVGIMERHPEVGLAYGRTYRLYPDQSLRQHFPSSGGSWRVRKGAAVLKSLCLGSNFPMTLCATMVRTSVQKQAGYFRPSLPHTDDFELWMRICCLADVADTDTVQGVFRIHDQAQSGFVHRDPFWSFQFNRDAFDSFFAHEGALLPHGRHLHRRALRGLAARAYWSAISHRCRGDREMSNKLFNYVWQNNRAMMLLPPVDYLFWHEDIMSRLAWGLAETSKRLRPAFAGRSRNVGRLS